MRRMARARLVGINHVALEVGDLDAALELYGRLFDFELRGRVPRDGVPRHGRPVPRRSPRAAGRGRTTAATSGSWSTTATPCAPRSPRPGIEPHRGRGLRFADPWGNEFEIVEYARRPVHEGRAGVLRGMGLDGLEKTEKAQARAGREGPALAPRAIASSPRTSRSSANSKRSSASPAVRSSASATSVGNSSGRQRAEVVGELRRCAAPRRRAAAPACSPRTRSRRRRARTCRRRSAITRGGRPAAAEHARGCARAPGIDCGPAGIRPSEIWAASRWRCSSRRFSRAIVLDLLLPVVGVGLGHARPRRRCGRAAG